MYALGILNFSWLPHIQHRYFAGIDGSRMSWTVIECGSYTTLAESTLEACSNATEFILRPEDFDSPPFMRVAKDWMM